jgi:release factor glutamine methyltransferase
VSTEAEPWTIRRLLEWTSGFFQRNDVDPARLSAEMLLAHVLNASRIKLYTEYDRIVPDVQLAAFRELVRRAAEHEPIAYLTGKAPFFNLEFHVTRDVLIPRPDTETLVENVLQLARITAGLEAPRVLDLCTGSGCIAAAIAHHHASATVVAADVSEPAVAIARRNLERLRLAERVMVVQGDLFAALRDLVDPRPFDLIVANPPYIPNQQVAQLDRNVRDYEPLAALAGGADGLLIHRRILAGAADRLRPGGRIYLEIMFDQGELARQVAAAHAWLDEVRIIKDHAGRDRVLTGRCAARG